MNSIRKRLVCAALSILTVGMLLTGCASAEKPQDPVTSTPSTAETRMEEASLYIGTVFAGFKEYPVQIDGEITPEALIDAISRLTGWNLSLADSVSSGKGGMTVSFTPDCAIFTGPSEPQKEEFFVYDNIGITQMILDSIQETLRRNFVVEPGDPSSLDVWFNVDNQPIEIEGMVIPLDQPWNNQLPTNEMQ